MKKILSLIIISLFISAQSFAVNFSISNETAKRGNIVKVKVSAKDFTNLSGIQLTINFDPTLLKYQEISFPNQDILKGYSINENQLDKGLLPFVWYEQSGKDGITLKENDVFFLLTFKAVGREGSNIPVSIINSPTPFKAVDNTLKYAPISKTDGSVSIIKNDMPGEIEIKRSAFGVDGNVNVLRWSMNEENLQAVLEKNTSGSDWSAISTIDDNQNEYEDTPAQTGQTSYRLKFINSGNKVIYSNIVSSNAHSNITLALKAGNNLRIDGFSAHESVQISVTDLAGRTVFNQKNTSDTEGGISFQIQNSGTNILLVTAQNNKTISTFKVLIP
jgi:Cohesin domain